VPSQWSDLERPPLRTSTLTRALVRPDSIWCEVRVLATSPSTNAVVAQEAAAGADEGLVIVAEHQTAGRGRLGRTWSAPPRAGLTFSALLRPAAVPESRWTWMPLLTGLAVAEGIEEATGLEPRLKWPNDVLLDGRKVAGVLLERQGSAVVVGIGINVTTSSEQLPTADATSLALEDAPITDRETVLRAVLRSLERHYQAWRDVAGDSTAVAGAYVERCATLGALVSVALPDGTSIDGVGERIDDDARLVVSSHDGERSLSAGDVVHVRAR
jgi:BirA family biotin operon repressor/biotin-[acetyl-CoA-carboxylase] ligase